MYIHCLNNYCCYVIHYDLYVFVYVYVYLIYYAISLCLHKRVKKGSERLMKILTNLHETNRPENYERVAARVPLIYSCSRLVEQLLDRTYK